MTLSVLDYTGRARDSRWERDLARQLRTFPEPQRLAFIQDLAVANPAVALDLAKKCLRERESFESLLDEALKTSNSSGIRYWLESIVPLMGIRRVVAYLQQKACFNADGVARAAYWLPMFSKISGYSREEVEALQSPR